MHAKNVKALYFVLFIGRFLITFSDLVVNIDMTIKLSNLSNEITAIDTYMID